MPFKSKKQMTYLQINNPELYKKWVKTYGKFEAEMPNSVKTGFGFATGMALFQLSIIAIALTLGAISKKE